MDHPEFRNEAMVVGRWCENRPFAYSFARCCPLSDSLSRADSVPRWLVWLVQRWQSQPINVKNREDAVPDSTDLLMRPEECGWDLRGRALRRDQARARCWLKCLLSILSVHTARRGMRVAVPRPRIISGDAARSVPTSRDASDGGLSLLQLRSHETVAQGG